ncbi:MAG TPA: nickel/cobalt transporter [Stellaceae bacterium]
MIASDSRCDGKRHVHPAVLAALIVASALALGTHSACAQVGPFGTLRPPGAGGIAGFILAKQALFYRALAGLIRSARNNGSALWGLMGVSFVYGIFHAAGPGHGKAVISSYLLANEETWRRGVALSLASAVMQSLTAIAIVAVAAVLLGATAKLMGDTVRVIEIVSYGLIVLLGARLLWVKGRSFLSALHARKAIDKAEARSIGDKEREHPAFAGRNHDHTSGHEHAHDHADQEASAHQHGSACSHPHHHDEQLQVLPWGHAHGPEPKELAGPGGWRRGLSAVVAVGLRPCSGAIIVLVFALAQGLFWAGVASTFVMGLGTAITVATIATLAVGAKAVAARLARARVGYGSVFLRAIEVGAAGLVLTFGILLLTGYMASEHLVGF